MMSSSLPRLGQSFTSPQSPRSIDEQQQIPRRHRSSLSIAEDVVLPKGDRRASLWSKRYQEIAKAEFVDQDISSVLEQFENISTYESIRTLKNNQKMTVACLLPDLNHDTLQEHEKSPTSNLQVLCLKEIKNKRNKRKFSSENPGMTPARILFDSERWTRSTRCDYCNLAGGDLECRTCDVIAHASCYLSSQDASKRKETGSFDILTIDPSWFCEHCHKCMLDEFNKQTVSARQFYLESRKNIFGKVIQAYVRMSKDASLFQKKKNAIVRIQAATRGKLARSSFNNLQRMRLKSYSIEMIRIKGLHRVVDGAPDGNSTSHSGNLTRQNNLTFRQSTRPFSPKDRKVIRPMISGEENKGEGKDELRLSNGFSCNPFLCVSIVDGIDDEHQIFCFETSVRKGFDNGIWNEKVFAPGVDGNVTICFTLLSKNGPNNFFLGQGILRLKGTEIWRVGFNGDLPLGELEIFPKTNQQQTMRVVDIGLFSTNLQLSIQIKPFSEENSCCGYMSAKNNIDSVQMCPRWCVLADGLLRVYRHYGVTLASEMIDMTRAIEVKLVEAKAINRQESCIFIHHMNRSYIFQCDHNTESLVWIKKLQASMRLESSSN